MMKDVEMEIKSQLLFRFPLFILIFGALILGCERRQKIYLDYEEVIRHSNYHQDIKENDIFYMYNKKDTIYLNKMETHTRAMSYLHKINITPTGTAITNLSNFTFENTTPELKVDLPKIYIVKTDFQKNELKIIEVRKSIIISRDNEKSRNDS